MGSRVSSAGRRVEGVGCEVWGTTPPTLYAPDRSEAELRVSALSLAASG